MAKVAVVLFNLGGPDSLPAVRPFLQNLFSDRAIIGLPALFRLPLAWFIAKRRKAYATMIYEKIGGKSPIFEETQAQARALETVLQARGQDAKCFVAMRYWHPFTAGAVVAVKAWKPDDIVLLPLYPQFSTTTTQSSLREWQRAAAKAHVNAPVHGVCCYPDERGFVAALSGLVSNALQRAKSGISYRVLFSAHGLPKRTVDKGDPYQWQVERTVAATVAALGVPDLDYSICYQSRVGPLEWIGPPTEAEIHRAGSDGKGVIVVPVAFVSEHSETLYELDMLYADLATASGVRDYIRVPAVRMTVAFIDGLADLTLQALGSKSLVNCASGRLCPPDKICAYRETMGESRNA